MALPKPWHCPKRHAVAVPLSVSRRIEQPKTAALIAGLGIAVKSSLVLRCQLLRCKLILAVCHGNDFWLFPEAVGIGSSPSLRWLG